MEDIQTKPRFISFGDLSLKNGYPFVVSLLFVIRAYIYLSIKKSNEVWKTNPLFFSLLLSFGESLNGILYLISRFLGKKRKQFLPKHHGTHNYKVIHTKNLLIPGIKGKMKSWKFYLGLYISSLVYGVQYSVVNVLTSFYDHTTDLSFEMRIFNLPFIAFLSLFALKYPIYKHQKFSCFLVVLGILLCALSKISTTFIDSTEEIIMNVFIYLFIYLLFSCREVFQKYLIETHNKTPIKIVFIEALFGYLNSIIILLLFSNTKFCSESTFILIGKVFSSKTWHLFCFYVLCCFLYGFFAVYTKFYYSPTVMPVAYSFSIMLWKIIISIEIGIENQEELASLFVPGYLILFLSCLLYNEIIIIYCCKLEENTKKEITRRSANDSKDLNLSMISINPGESLERDYL